MILFLTLPLLNNKRAIKAMIEFSTIIRKEVDRHDPYNCINNPNNIVILGAACLHLSLHVGEPHLQGAAGQEE